MPTDLRQLLRQAAATPVEALDLERAFTRGRRRRWGRRLSVAAGSLTLLVAGGTWIVSVSPPGPDERAGLRQPLVVPSPLQSIPGTREQTPVVSEPARSAFRKLAPGWTDLPAPPEVRSSAATAWTGDKALIWGGYVYTGYSDESLEADGFAFDAREREWGPMARSPLGPRAQPASAWTGHELLVWGGWDNGGGQLFGDGAAYDPRADTWRRLPEAPITARAAHSVWTGREFIVWGTAVRADEPPRDGAAYDPATDTWRTVAEAPIELTDAAAVWTGREMIVFGAGLSGGNFAATVTAIGAAYDPQTDTWRRLPDSELSPQASTAAWNGEELIAWDYLHETATYDPATDVWRPLPDVPLDDFECSPQSASVGGYIFGDYCGLMAVHDSADGGWHDVSRRMLSGWGFELVAADPAVLLLGQDVDSGKKRMLAYRPPTW